MASHKEYLDFILEQLSELEDVSYRAMMGEYILYYRGKVVGGIYDDRFLVKPVKSSEAMMPNASRELPYDGAKEMLLVDDVENRAFLRDLLEAMVEELPAPKNAAQRSPARQQHLQQYRKDIASDREGTTDYTHHYTSPLGGITLASDGEALTGLWFDGQAHFAESLGTERKEKDLAVFSLTERWLDTYFSGRAPDFTPPLSLRTTAFRRLVWEILLTIPYGGTMSYGQIAEEAARRMGRPRMSAQAVGGAVGHNPISLIIPCHRVVGTDGSLTGYAGGIDRKARLLAMEGVKY